MTIKSQDMVSVQEHDGLHTVILWTPSGLPVPLKTCGYAEEAKSVASRAQSVIRQWARVLRNVEEVT